MGSAWLTSPGHFLGCNSAASSTARFNAGLLETHTLVNNFDLGAHPGDCFRL